MGLEVFWILFSLNKAGKKPLISLSATTEPEIRRLGMNFPFLGGLRPLPIAQGLSWEQKSSCSPIQLLGRQRGSSTQPPWLDGAADAMKSLALPLGSTGCTCRSYW